MSKHGLPSDSDDDGDDDSDDSNDEEDNKKKAPVAMSAVQAKKKAAAAGTDIDALKDATAATSGASAAKKSTAPAGPTKIKAMDIKKMNGDQLKEALKERSLDLQGQKKDLIKRLCDYEAARTD
jgi:hypothetical protein